MVGELTYLYSLQVSAASPMPGQPQEVGKTQRWLTLVTVSAGLLLISLDNSILYTALPTLNRELNTTAGQGLWIINAYPLVMAGLLLGAGTLGDKLGHRRVFTAGLVIFGIASLVAAFSPTPEFLIGARAALAVGAAGMMPATLAIVRLTFTDIRERNIAIAIWGCISLGGATLGPIVGGALLQFFWWGSVFLINVPVVIAALIATILFVRPDQPDPSRKWDAFSSGLALVTLSALVFAFKEGTAYQSDGRLTMLAVFLAVVAAVGFVVRQRHLDDPLLTFDIFQNRAFSAGVITAGFAMFAAAGLQLIASQRLQLVDGLTPLQAGAIVASVVLGALPMALVGGGYLHVLGLRLLISGGLALSAVGIVLAWLTAESPLIYTIGGLIFTGLGLGAAMSVASTAIVGNAPPARAGMASSVEEVSYEFGSLAAVTVLGSLLTSWYVAFLARPDLPPEARESFQATLIFAEGDAELTGAAVTAFTDSYSAVLLILAAGLVIGAVATGWLLRHHGLHSAATVYDAHGPEGTVPDE